MKLSRYCNLLAITLITSACITTNAYADMPTGVLLSRPLMADHSGSFGWNSNGPIDGNVQQMSNSFLLDESGSVGNIGFWGSYHGNAVPNGAQNYLIRFFADAGGVPAATPYFEQAVAAEGTDSGQVNSQGHTIRSYSASISGANIVGGSVTYVSILENDVNPDAMWVWSFTDDLDTAYSRTGDGGNWGGPFTGNAFVLSAVPAPGALALLGIAGLTARRRRRN